MLKNKTDKRKRLSVVIGGADKVDAALNLKSLMDMDSIVESNKTEISDWEELQSICYSAAQKHSLTKEDSRKLLHIARQGNEGNR
jgi:hypothetical protein